MGGVRVGIEPVQGRTLYKGKEFGEFDGGIAFDKMNFGIIGKPVKSTIEHLLVEFDGIQLIEVWEEMGDGCASAGAGFNEYAEVVLLGIVNEEIALVGRGELGDFYAVVMRPGNEFRFSHILVHRAGQGCSCLIWGA